MLYVTRRQNPKIYADAIGSALRPMLTLASRGGNSLESLCKIHHFYCSDISLQNDFRQQKKRRDQHYFMCKCCCMTAQYTRDPLAMYIVPKADWQSQITRVRHMAWETRAHRYHIPYERDRCWVRPVRPRASLSSASLSLTALLSHFRYQMYPMHMLCRVLQPKCSYRISLVNCHSRKHHWDQVQI